MLVSYLKQNLSSSGQPRSDWEESVCDIGCGGANAGPVAACADRSFPTSLVTATTLSLTVNKIVDSRGRNIECRNLIMDVV